MLSAQKSHNDIDGHGAGNADEAFLLDELEKRQKKKSKTSQLVHKAASSEARDNSHSNNSNAVARQEFDFNEQDGEGFDYHNNQGLAAGDEQPDSEPDSEKKRAPRAVGNVRKIADNVVADAYGKWVEAKQGRIQINIGKFILRKVLQAEVAGFVKYKDKSGDPITTDHYECMVHSCTSNVKHPRFVKVGKETGNIIKHCDRFHSELLLAIERLVKETPAHEAVGAITSYVKALKPPTGDADKYFKRKEKSTIRLETAALIWFLDAQIAFDQFDNPLFTEMILTNSQTRLPKSETVVDALLPVLYQYVQKTHLDFFACCPSYFTSFDSWSKFGEKFVSQNYHMIDPRTFTFRILLLDVIPFRGQQFAECYAAALAERQSHWTNDMKPEPVRAGGMADSESKPQAGGRLLYGDDMSRCQNHKLKKVYEVGEQNSLNFRHDFAALTSMISYVEGNANIARNLAYYQDINNLSRLGVILYNATRWESRYLCTKQLCKLENSLPQVFTDEEQLQIWREDCRDFLTPSYFARMRGYLVILKDMNRVSKLYQTQSFPTGCFVPLCISYLKWKTKPDPAMDSQFLLNFKEAFHQAIDEYMWIPVMTKANNFLKAALLHPGVSAVISKFLPVKLIDKCYDAILEDAEVFVGDKSNPRYQMQKNFLTLSLQAYRAYVGSVAPPDIPDADYSNYVSDVDFSQVRAVGEVLGHDHIGFWGKVAKEGQLFLEGSLLYCLPVAAMLLAQPAGEAVDEFAFSSSGATYTKTRSSLSPMRVEMITVIRMFIRNFKWSPSKIDEYLGSLKPGQKPV